ncbi:MAG: hypothetical protein NT026_00575 [Candidatus Staskawiczbacteria bacterium]|nr:hypothetical protein [Candidatus Staskawiczbacteria bacterium]
MDFSDKVRNFLEKLRALSDFQKKAIIFSVAGILGVIMFIFWIRGAMDSISKIGQTPITDISQTTTPSSK